MLQIILLKKKIYGQAISLLCNFATVRTLLFFVLLGFSTSCFGQDSLLIKFGPRSQEITAAHAIQINDLFKNRVAKRIKVIGYFSSEGSVSTNRILAEMRLLNVRLAVLDQGMPFSMISSTLVLKEGSDNSVVKIVVLLASEKGAGVLKKSSVVQISQFDFAKPKKIAGVVNSEAETENEIVLDEAAFRKDATVSLPNLIFQGSSHYFISSSERVLRALLKVMKSRTDIEIELQGHVCCNPPGVDAFDKHTGKKNLSVMRALAVYNYLIAGGIPASRMTYRGFGSSQRLYPDEKNPREQMLNRRVEVLITASD